MGNRYGASGREVVQGHFANHPGLIITTTPGVYTCQNTCNDPGACWNWGKKNQHWSESRAYAQFNRRGDLPEYDWLYDNGDPNCTLSGYWMDLYHGRFKTPYAPCNCRGVVGFCYDASPNSCDDAINFGIKFMPFTYY